MPHINEAFTSFAVDGSKAQYINVPAGASVTVANNGNTLYYADTSDVTSSSNDGSIATAASATFTSGQYVICAQGVATNVFTTVNETVTTSDLTVSDDVTVTGDLTTSGTTAVTPASAPASVFSALPASATSGTDTAFADGTTFLTSVFVPCNMTVTGVGFLVGSVGGTDKVIVRLYNSAGTLLASSTTASSGTTAGTAAQLQEIAFTATYAATGPRRYFIGISANGLTAKLRTLPAYTGAKTFSGSVALTHAATTAITPPTAFAADKAPFAYLY